MGLPSIVVSVASNQIMSSEVLGSENRVKYLGRSTDLGPDDYLSEIESFLESSQLSTMSQLGTHLVDGLGTSRVNAIMKECDQNEGS